MKSHWPYYLFLASSLFCMFSCASQKSNDTGMTATSSPTPTLSAAVVGADEEAPDSEEPAPVDDAVPQENAVAEDEEGCDVNENAECVKAGLITLRKGVSKCATGYDSGVWPAYSQDDLQALWSAFFACDATGPALPSVDFEKEIIMLAYLQTAYEDSYEIGYVRDVSAGGGWTNFTVSYADNSCQAAQKVKYASQGNYVLPKEETAYLVLRAPATSNQIGVSFVLGQTASCPP